MKILTVLLVLSFGGIVMPATAADMGTLRPSYSRDPAPVLPFPRSDRAQAIWAEGACWRGCQATCTWDLATCLSFDRQGRCLKYTNACDRSCQQACRQRGGPYLAIGD